MKTVLKSIAITLALGAGAQTAMKAVASESQMGIEGPQGDEQILIELLAKQAAARDDNRLELSGEERIQLVQTLKNILKLETRKLTEAQATAEPGI